jgi:hypothetical protein
MTNATVFDAKAWEWNKDSLTIMEMQEAELQVLCTCYNLKPTKTGKAAVATAIVNHLMVPRADVVTKQDVHNAIEVTMEQQCITQSVEEVFGNRQVALGKAIKHSHKP